MLWSARRLVSSRCHSLVCTCASISTSQRLFLVATQLMLSTTHDTTQRLVAPDEGSHATGSTVWGPGALGGKLLKAVGEVIVDGVEYGIARRRMSSIKKRLKREPIMFLYPAQHIPEELQGISRDLHEMSRDVYPSAIREIAVALSFYIDICDSLAFLRESVDLLLAEQGYLDNDAHTSKALDYIEAIRWHPEIRVMSQRLLRDLKRLTLQKSLHEDVDLLGRQPFEGEMLARYLSARDNLVCNGSMMTSLRKLYQARFRFPDRFLPPE